MIQVTDTCTTCPPKQLNLHYTAFKQYIADPALGTVGVQYRQVVTSWSASALVAIRQQGGQANDDEHLFANMRWSPEIFQTRPILLQVECQPSGPIVIRIAAYRPSAGALLVAAQSK